MTLYNKKLIYDLLFLSSSETLLSFGRDPKWIGGTIGFYGVMHTWGQKLWQHPHVHYIIPSGAITSGNQWVPPNYGGKFLFPVRALSKVFRGKFIEGLKKVSTEVKGKEQIAQVATITAVDRTIGNLIAEVMEKVGKDGVITVEESKGLEYETEYVEGM